MTRRNPFLSFVADGDRLALRPRSATISKEIGRVDYSEIESTQIVPGSRSVPDASPISFEWGASNPKDTHVQLGYLTGTADVTNKYKASLNNTLNLQILGTGNVMRGDKVRAWRNATIQEVLSDVLSDHRFNLAMDDHPTRWTMITQQNESDWELVGRLAKKIGYWPYLNGSTMYVLNPDTLATRQSAVTLNPVNSAIVSQTTMDFPQVGNSVISDRIGQFVEQTTGAVQKVFPDSRVPLSSQTRTVTGRKDTVSITEESYGEAQASMEGIERNNAWHIERKLTIDGRSDLRPLMSALIPNTRVRKMDSNGFDQGWEEYDGMWLIKGVNSKLSFHSTDISYNTEVTVVRDARGANPNVRQRRAAPLVFSDQPSTNLLNGAWVAAWRNS